MYVFDDEDDEKKDAEVMPDYWEQMGYVPCPFYDRVTWEELAGESLTHDTGHVDHVDHVLHSTAATS